MESSDIAEIERPNLFAAIGYVGEVSEPNGDPVEGYFLDKWGQKANRKFVRYIEQREAALLARIENSILALPTTRSQSLSKGWDSVGLDAALEAVRDCFEDLK